MEVRVGREHVLGDPNSSLNHRRRVGSFVNMGKMGLVEKIKGPGFRDEDIVQWRHFSNHRALGSLPSTTHKPKL